MFGLALPLALLASADDFLAFPGRSALVSSGTTVAWVESVRGVANVWLAAAPLWRPRAITNFKEDATTISGLCMHGDAVLFVRGAKAGVNALAATAGALPAATWLAADKATPRIVANESMVGTSPHGALFTRAEGTGTALYEIALHDGIHTSAQRLFGVAKGKLGGFAWRGNVLAFSNDRGSHGFVGLYSYGHAAITWVAPSVDLDVQPTWNIDGSASLAWLRVRPPVDDDGFGAFDGDQGNRGPDFTVWLASVLVSDASIDVEDARPIFDDDKYGLPTFGYGRRPLVLAGGLAYVGSEALSGWLHLLAINASSGAARELRGGSCEDREWLVADG